MNSYNCCQLNNPQYKGILAQLDLIKLLADKNRLQILCLLNTQACKVNQLAEYLNISQSLLSHHLSSLRILKLVNTKKTGRQVTYSLSGKGKQVINLLSILNT